MAESVRRTVVVSAVNLRKGGTLTILRQCLDHLSHVAPERGLRVVALVHKRELCDFPGIEYIEMPWCVRSWFHRLWAEYVTMMGVSRRIAAEDGRKVWLWLSMHDTTPRVDAEHQEVYCHTSFPFMKIVPRDFLMDPKIPLFAMFTKWAYRINVRRNDSIIVQQEWFADAMSRLVRVGRQRFRVIPPQTAPQTAGTGSPVLEPEHPFTFLYASTPDAHKNFETLCRAARLLEKECDVPFRVALTVTGDENRYARWLRKKWGDVASVDFRGFMTKEELYKCYAGSDCLVFPSRIETWGLPVSEFISVKKGLGLDADVILADLPYAHETSSGGRARFFPAMDPESLMLSMKKLMVERYESTSVG